MYPYGDPDDDWLNIDVTRGTGRAGDFFSNDQLVGWIDITQEHNPRLRDKTNREGLIETGGAARDLIFLVQTFLSYVKQYPYARHQQKTAAAQHRPLRARRGGRAESGGPAGGTPEFGVRVTGAPGRQGRRGVRTERQHLTQRADTAEDLAGVGLSVEMASHDIMLLMSRAQDIARRIARSVRAAGNGDEREQADMLVGVLQQITDGMQEVQILFQVVRGGGERFSESSRCWTGSIRSTRRCSNREASAIARSPPRARRSPPTRTDGVVMQVLINLFDNACYWLDTVEPARREITVTVDGNQGDVIFSDSGPGVDPDGPGLHIRAVLLRQGTGGTGPGFVHRAPAPGNVYGLPHRDGGRSAAGPCRAPTSSSAS